MSLNAENSFPKYEPVTLFYFLNASLLGKKNKEIQESFPFCKGELDW